MDAVITNVDNLRADLPDDIVAIVRVYVEKPAWRVDMYHTMAMCHIDCRGAFSLCGKYAIPRWPSFASNICDIVLLLDEVLDDATPPNDRVEAYDYVVQEQVLLMKKGVSNLAIMDIITYAIQEHELAQDPERLSNAKWLEARAYHRPLWWLKASEHDIKPHT